MNEFLTKFEWGFLWPIAKSALLVIGGFVFARLATRSIKKLNNDHISAQQKMILEKLVYIVVLLLFIISALQQLNFQLSVLLGSAGILTAAVGFASKSSISNIISGIFLIAEKSFEVGDTIKVGSNTGVVRSIDFLSVKIRTFDSTLVRIPNEKILSSDLVNLTHYHTRRIDIMLGIAYEQEIPPVKEALLALADNNDRALKKPSPMIRVTEFADSAINLRFSVYAAREDYGSLKGELFEQIKVMFDEKNFNIPFPQLTIHQLQENT